MNHILYWASALGTVLCLASAADAETTLLDSGYRQMYNFQFDQAHQTFAEWHRLHPTDSIAAVSDAAAYLFSEFERLHILQLEFLVHDNYFYLDRKPVLDPFSKQKFESALNHAAELSAREPRDPNAIFAMVLCHGLRSNYLAFIEEHYAASFREIKVARTLAEQLLARHPEYYDAWIVIGLENYILSLESTPVRWLVRLSGGQTKQALGIEKLRLTAEKGRYLAPFARLLLAVVAIRDHNTAGARDLLEGLAREFPNNSLYSQELALLSR
jgi:hypothetical protein